MILTHATLDALRTNFYADFQRGFSEAPSFADRLAMAISSSTLINTYGFLEKLPKMREWLGPRVVVNLKERAYQLANKDWELTVAVGRNEILDDNLGMYGPLFSMMGMSTRQLPDDQLTILLESGHLTTSGAPWIGYDGLPIFSASHAIEGDAPATQSNYLTSTALTHANYQVARAAMGSFVGYDGRPMASKATVLMVPNVLEKTGKQILNAEFINDGNTTSAVSNVNKGSAELVVNPFLSDTGGANAAWYLFDLSKPIKPFIHQKRSPPVFVRKDAPTDDNVFSNKEFLYGVDSREAFGVALWWMALKAVG